MQLQPYKHHDGRLLLLGKGPARFSPKALDLARYAAALPAPPPSVDWSRGIVHWGVMGNDTLGDCTCAAYGHGGQVVTLNTPTGMRTPPDNLILNLYSKSCGWVPGDPTTDNGGIITSVLDYTLQHGLGHKEKPEHHRKFPLLAYANVSPFNLVHVKQAIQSFATVDIGLQLPISAQSQVGFVWDIVGDPSRVPTSAPGSWGGHSVIVLGYNPQAVLCITWGQLQWMTWRFWHAYCDEAYALLYHAWLDHFGATSPQAEKQMEQELVLVKG